MKNKSVDEFESLYKKKRSYLGLKIFVLLFSFFILVIVSVYTYISISAVDNRMSIARKHAEGITPINASLLDQLKEKAWVESRLKMASGDSIGLSIDLSDHFIQLELKGVVLMKSKIRDVSISGFFKRMDGNVYFSMFGSPLKILRFESSIAKNPFKVIKAPKTTEEADANDAKKDSVLKENVYWTVKLNHDIDLNIQGIDSIVDSQAKYKFGQGFEFKRDIKNIKDAIHQIIKFEKPKYTPEILISIPENEAKSVLRALPRNALVTIRI